MCYESMHEVRIYFEIEINRRILVYSLVCVSIVFMAEIMTDTMLICFEVLAAVYVIVEM